MNPTDLRLGNYIYEDTYHDPYKITEVTHLDPVSINYQNTYECKQPFEPIPLTEEWLLKFGFIQRGMYGDDVYSKEIKEYKEFILMFYDIDDHYFLCDTDIDTSIKYVHQLQNLYFALTGSELEIKEEVIN